MDKMNQYLDSSINQEERHALLERSKETHSFVCKACGEHVNKAHALWFLWPERNGKGASGGWVLTCTKCGMRHQLQQGAGQSSQTRPKVVTKAKPQKKSKWIKWLLLILLLLFIAFKFLNPFGSDSLIFESTNGNPSRFEPSDDGNTGAGDAESGEVQNTDAAFKMDGYPSSEYSNSYINISEGGYMVADSDYIYYTNSADSYKIYRMDHNMNNSEKICDTPAHYLNLYAGDLYFGGSSENDNKGLYRLDLDTFSHEMLSSASIYEPKIVNGCIYYEDIKDDFSLWRYEIDSGRNDKLCEGIVFYCCIGENAIYYIDTWDDNKVYSIDLNGNGKKLLYDGKSCRELALQDGILYSSRKDGGIYAHDLSDGTIHKISDTNVKSMNVCGDSIYYASVDNQDRLYKMGIDGSNEMKIVNNSVAFVNVYGNLICYQDTESKDFFWLVADQGKATKVW